jgi:hypothetical protein
VISPNLHHLLAEARIRELHRVAAARQNQRAALPAADTAREAGAVTLRFGYPDDRDAIARLADLDCSAPPAEPVLLAEVAGEPRAAISLADGTAISDPFHPTAELIELLRTRAQQLQAPRDKRRSLRPWLWHRASTGTSP